MCRLFTNEDFKSLKECTEKNIVVSLRFHGLSILMVKEMLAYSTSKKFRGKWLISVKADYKFFFKNSFTEVSLIDKELHHLDMCKYL